MRTSTITGALLAGGLLLAGCTPSEQPSNKPPVPGTPPPATAQAAGGEHGAEDAEPTGTDQEFAQQMLAHHRQAIDLAVLASKNGESSQVKDLATRIQQGQQPEIDQIKVWLGLTGGQKPGSAPEDSGEHADMPGMQSPQKMQQLSQMRGADFDRAWSQVMVDHHQGALQMARTELEEGAAPQMRQIAEKVIATQQAEIDDLKKLAG